MSAGEDESASLATRVRLIVVVPSSTEVLEKTSIKECLTLSIKHRGICDKVSKGPWFWARSCKNVQAFNVILFFRCETTT